MKVFISWSGQRSAAVADALRYWLPKVIQALEPWMSADDIEKGTRWRSGLASELEQSSVGIICLTRENLDSTWIHFEAGALSRQQDNTYVCTLLFGLEPTDVREPLAQFQHTRTQKDDVRKLISTINNTLGDSKLPESELGETFEVWWPKLEGRLNAIPANASESAEPIRRDREILEEILELARSQGRERIMLRQEMLEGGWVSGETLTRKSVRLLAKHFGLSQFAIRGAQWEIAHLTNLLTDLGRTEIKEARLTEDESALNTAEPVAESEDEPDENSNS
jgi:hypothetical protein